MPTSTTTVSPSPHPNIAKPTQAPAPAPASLPSLRAQYISQGYIILPSLVPPDLFPDLIAASDRVTALARNGTWPHIRVVGKDFPPWDSGPGKEVEVWGVQNVMHPKLKEAVFAKWYGSEEMVRVSAGLMGCDVGDMQFELFNLLVNPSSSAYSLTWHRDDVKPTVRAGEEKAALEKERYGIQWNTALYDDDCLSVVPGSHARACTEVERRVCLAGGAGGGEEMPGAVRVRLKAGETVFYNNNILHVGSYDAARKRRTLHGCYGCPPVGDVNRARNILQHDLTYTLDPDFRSSLPEGLRGMVDRLNEMQALLAGETVEYSL